MNQFNDNYNLNRTDTRALSNTFVSNVFLWMFAALGITAATAFLFANNDVLFSSLIQITPNGGAKVSTLGWIVTFAPFNGIVNLLTMIPLFIQFVLDFLFTAW